MFQTYLFSGRKKRSLVDGNEVMLDEESEYAFPFIKQISEIGITNFYKNKKGIVHKHKIKEARIGNAFQKWKQFVTLKLRLHLLLSDNRISLLGVYILLPAEQKR